MISMSVYSTPKKTCFDEGSSPLSNQSFYFTPRETFSHFTPRSQTRRRNTRYTGNIPKFNVYNADLSRSEENLKNDKDFIISSSPISVKDYVGWGCRNSRTPTKETIISFDKENFGVQLSSTPSLRCSEKNPNFLPLKNISNSLPNDETGTVFEARISSVGKQHFNLRITTETNVEKHPHESFQNNASHKKSDEREILSRSKEKQESRKTKNKDNGISFRHFGIGQKFSRKSGKSVDLKNVEKSKVMVDMPTQTDDKITLNYVCKEAVENTDTCMQKICDVEEFRNESLDINKILVEAEDSDVSLLVSKRNIDGKMVIWPFSKIAKLRISPVKRLFSKSSKYLISLKQKIIRKFSKQPFKKLLDCEEEKPCPSTEISVCNTQHNVCSLCLGNLTNREDMMSKALSALMMKLSNVEDELKEIKGLVKSGVTSSNTVSCIKLPPPPPPPPPPNFLSNDQSTGTLKRKADLTTPECENHAVKRPAIKNEKTHFAITVEDIRSVKLRKTPATILKKEIKDHNVQNNEELLRSLKMKKTKKNTSDVKRRTQNLAELCSRENVTFNRSAMDSINLPTPHKKNLPSTFNYEETPVTSKNTLNSGRSHKRKELVIESPVRKRINTGNNSAIYCDEFKD